MSQNKPSVCVTFWVWPSDQKVGQNQNSGTDSPCGLGKLIREGHDVLSLRLTTCEITHAGSSLCNLTPEMLSVPVWLLGGRHWRRCWGGRGWRGRGWFGFGMKIIQSQEIFRSHSVWIHWGRMQRGWCYWEEALSGVLRVLWGCGHFCCGLHKTQKGRQRQWEIQASNSAPATCFSYNCRQYNFL